MSDRHIGSTALPAYAKYIAPTHGAWRRRWMNLFLRFTAKRMLRPGADVVALRERQAGFDVKFGNVDPLARRTPVDMDGVPGEWIDVPESRPDRVLLYLHGGAFVFRFPETHAALAARWCRRMGARALLVDYRLAPEHPYPAGADDCHAAYRWLLRQGTRPEAVVLAGDSAGANLALSTLHRTQAAGEALPACAVLMSPFVDFTLSSASLVANQGCDPIFSLTGMLALRGLYAPPETYLDPSVSPLFGEFRGLPPLLIQAGSIEMLLDESLRAAERAHAAGVAVELEIWDRLPHVFQALDALPQAALAADSVVRFVGTHAGWRA